MHLAIADNSGRLAAEDSRRRFSTLMGRRRRSCSPTVWEWDPALGSRHEAAGTRRSAVGTLLPALGTRHAVPGTRHTGHLAPGPRGAALGAWHLAPAPLCPAPGTRHRAPGPWRPAPRRRGSHGRVLPVASRAGTAGRAGWGHATIGKCLAGHGGKNHTQNE